MRKTIIMLGLLLLLTQTVMAQCSPNPCYTANPPTITKRTSAQVGALGLVAINMNSSATSSGAPRWHKGTVGNGTYLDLNWQAYNATAVDLYYSLDGGTRTMWSSPGSLGESGTLLIGMQAAWVGHVLNLFMVATGSSGTTQDVNNLTVTSQAPGIYSSDLLDQDTYLHFHASGGGGSMLNDFTECQAGQIHQCINATHTPFTTLTVHNLMSGETQFHSKHISGNTASANQMVSFSDDMFFSALPEDVFEYTEGDEVDCSVFGPIGVGPVHMDIRFERAITEEYISSILNSNGMHPEHIYCIIAATPPDFPGADEALPGTPSGQIVNIAFLYREWPAGTQEAGTQWNLVFPDIQEVGIGYYVKTTMEPDPSGCTMWDNGFRHLPLPTPLDPQPQ